MKLQSIQVLRGIAALLVVVYHARAMEMLAISRNGSDELPWLNGLVTNGYAGVDLFFVISGFVMVYVTRDAQPGIRSSLDFLFARATRIYPLWWVFAGLMTLMFVGYGVLGAERVFERASNDQRIDTFLWKSFLLVPQDSHPVLGVGWTLIHEVYFYAVFAVMLLVPRQAWLWILLAWGLMIVSGTFLGFTESFVNSFRVLIFYPMTMEFIIGAVVGLAVTSGMVWRSGAVTLVAVLWLLASLSLQGIEDAGLLTWGRVIWFGLPCAALVYGVATLEQSRREAWLIPAGIGAAAGIVICLLYNLFSESSFSDRLGATIMSVIIGAIAMLAVLWLGWLGGQAAPDKVRAMQPGFSAVYRRLAVIGEWSFSLYLCHPLILPVVRLVFAKIGQVPILAPVFRAGHPGLLDNIALIGVSLIASILVAAVSFRVIEQPAIRGFGWLRRKIFDRDQSRLA